VGNPYRDERPAVWVGHVALGATDLAASRAFFEALGMRLIEAHERVVVLELRGGTHLVLLPAREPVAAGARAPFDLMVEDLDAAWANYTALGLAPSEIRDGAIHRSFDVVAPSGHLVTVNSSHVSGRPV
jgi:catechol 2,3-dioxygenase-like lactoylglutathione lyase family enzyme